MSKRREVKSQTWSTLRERVEEDGQIPCRNEPEAWFAVDNLRLRDPGEGVTTEERDWARQQYAMAKQLCRTECSARAACLAAALEYEGASDMRLRFGVWGGLDPGERCDKAREMGLKEGGGR
jgi:hypothetical protein